MGEESGTEVEVLPAAEPAVERTELVVRGEEPAEAMLWRHFRKVGLSLAQSGFVPAGFKGKPDEIMACLAYGHELGLGPMQSLQSLDVIQGKPTLKPEMMRSLIRAAGHSLVREEATSERVTFRGRRADTGDEETVTFTIDDANAMGLLGKDNWRKMPRAMLTARATAEIARSLFSDVIMGASYTPEEMGDDRTDERSYLPAYVETIEAALPGGGPIPFDPPREPPVRIVQSDPQHAGHVVAGKPSAEELMAPPDDPFEGLAPEPTPERRKPIEWGWSYEVDTVTREKTPICNRCGHAVADHAFVRRGCHRCACNYVLDADNTMKPVGAASPPESDEAPPAGPTAVADRPVNADDPGNPDREGDAPPPTSGADPTVTPHAEGSAPLPNPATEGQFRAIHAALSKLHVPDEGRHTLVRFVTASRTQSSREITGPEASMLLDLAGHIRVGRLAVEERDGEWQILALNDKGLELLQRIERGVLPAQGRRGGQRTDVVSASEPEPEPSSEF